MPESVSSYGFIAIGGAGRSEPPGHGLAGSGALVSGVLDVRGISSMDYWVGCNGKNHDGAGYGKNGHGGSGEYDGLPGGGATMIALPDPFTPLVTAGGGGGGGGDTPNSVGVNACDLSDADNLRNARHCGGAGGSAGGDNGERYSYDGVHSGDGVGGAAGGFSNAHRDHGRSTPDGAKGEHSDQARTGGGGGGGAGWPRGGTGGHQSHLDGGGGGGAGGSYYSGQRVSHGSISPSGIIANAYGPLDGAILLFPFSPAMSSLTVEKAVSGDAASFATGPFTVEVDCTLAGRSVLKESVGLAPGGSHTFDGVIAGSVCAISEPDAGGASTPAPPRTVTVGEDPVTVKLTNEFAATSFTVSLASVLRGEGGGPAPGVHVPLGALGVHVTCTLAGHPLDLPAPVSGGQVRFTGEDTWATGGAKVAVEGVPVGAKCHAKLASDSGATSTAYTVNGTETSDDGVSFTLAAEQTSVAVTNTYQLAPLTVSKAADGDADPPAGGEYSGQVSCTFQGRAVTLPDTAAFTLGVGDSGQVHDLPVGARCTVDETDRGTAIATSYSPAQTVPVTEGPGAAITVTNTFDTGSLIVSVGTEGAGAGWANTPFTLHVTCMIGETQVLDQSFTTDSATGGKREFDVGGGAVCTAVETVTGGAASVSYASSADRAPSTDPVQVTVPADQSAGLEIVNTFTAAPVQLVTSTSGDGARYASAATTVTVSDCRFNGQAIEIIPGRRSASFLLPADGGTALIPELVTGAECSVIETDDAGATASEYTPVNAEPVIGIDGGGLRVTVNPPEGVQPTAVLIDNRFDLAALTVTTVVDGPAAWAANTPFVTVVQCTFQDAPVTRLGPDGIATLIFAPDGTLEPGHGARALETLSVGTRCHATETRTGGATTVTYSPADDAGTGSADVVIPDGPGATIDITNTFAATSLAVNAVVDGNDAAAHAGDEFHFELSCLFGGAVLPTPPDQPDESAVFTLTGGQTEVRSGLPVGADCVVDEFDSGNATAVTPNSIQNVTLTTDTATLTFRNVFEAAPLTVRENLTGDGADTYGAGQTFTARVRCIRTDGPGAVPLPDRGIVELSADNDFEATIDAPVNTECAVGQGAQMATAQMVSPPVTITSGGDHILTITSAFLLGEFSVSKTAHGRFDPGQTFRFDTACVWPGEDGPVPIPLNDNARRAFSLENGQEHSIRALQGARCTLTETDTGGAVRVVIDAHGAEATADGVKATFVLTSAPTVVAFTNYLPGSLPVTGTEVSTTLVLAVILMLLGGAVFTYARRRRTRH